MILINLIYLTKIIIKCIKKSFLYFNGIEDYNDYVILVKIKWFSQSVSQISTVFNRIFWVWLCYKIGNFKTSVSYWKLK